jgi:hypothetical protein
MELDDLKGLFRAKELTFDQWRSDVAAAHSRAESRLEKACGMSKGKVRWHSEETLKKRVFLIYKLRILREAHVSDLHARIFKRPPTHPYKKTL